MPTYGSPLTYAQTFTATSINWLAQCSYDGGANAYAFQRYTAGDGRQFYRAELRANDPGIFADIAAGRDRSEIQIQSKLTRGARWEFAGSFKVNSPLAPTGSFQQLLQIHGTANAGQSGGSSLFALELKTATKALQFRRRSNATGLDADYTDYPLMWVDPDPVTTDQWYYYYGYIIEGWNNDATVVIWLQKPGGAMTQVVNLTGTNIGYNDTVGPYWKLGLYRGGSATDTLVVEYANNEFKDNGTSLSSRIASPLSTAVGTYTLTASPGHFTTGGSGASFFINRRLRAQSGSFTATGSANLLLGSTTGKLDIAKQVGYAFLQGPQGLKLSKQVAYAALVYPKIDIAKQADYVQLDRPAVQIGKQVVYALLRPAPPSIEASLAFTASARLGLSWRLEPELTQYAAIGFRASARLRLSYHRDPPFDCEVPETTTWTKNAGGTTSWATSTQQTTDWRCADEPAEVSDLIGVTGDYITTTNGLRIRLI